MQRSSLWIAIVIGAVLVSLSSFASGEEVVPVSPPAPPGSWYNPDWKPVDEPNKYSNDGLPGGNPVAYHVAEFRMSKGFVGTVESRVYQDPTSGQCTFAYVFRHNKSSTGQHLVMATFYEDGTSNPWHGVAVSACGADGSGFSGTNSSKPEWTNGDPYYIGIRDEGGTSERPVFCWRGNGGIGTEIAAGDWSSVIWLTTDSPDWQIGGMRLGDQGTDKVDVLVPRNDGSPPQYLCSLPQGWWRYIAAAAAARWLSSGAQARLLHMAAGCLHVSGR